METKKENRKGVWASLFSPKPCSCSSNLVVEKPKNKKNSCSNNNHSSKSTENIQEIKILGSGCTKCKSTYQIIQKVVDENGLNVKLTKVEDIVEIINYNVMTTPAVMVDGVVKIKGHVPSENEIKQILGV